ncbi:MAG: phospholipase C, phosphocholine-specific [Pseudomonadota bacterium]|nr:phospholipase C, phosphocholine-specific [Pseudomonadota bacterium]
MTSPRQRRDFLRLTAAATAAAAATPGALAQTIRRALSLPATCRTGTIQDVEHIVILMQENRSFDHYFGSLRGVRGFGDPRPVMLADGKPVWFQPHGSGSLLPYRPSAEHLGLQYMDGTPHGWNDTHGAWNLGRYDQWVANKGTTTMAHLTRQDIPFHYQLADAFTICDAYHCSLMGPTDPNRYYMWTGWVGNDGSGGGPVISNAEAGYGWSTYPEVLERAGVSWKIYQDVGTGLDAAGSWGWTGNPYIGNYGDNSLLYFHQYQNAPPGSALYQKARTGTHVSAGGSLFDVLEKDVAEGTLPQVSWIVAPEAFSEHPNWPANFGAWYIEQVLKTLTSDPDLWGKTALFITYDENDGFFDHVVPPYAPHTRAMGASTIDTVGEFFSGGTDQPGPYGLGARVPMIVVSPWTRGGWLCSETFDHTSLIRFIEKRFGGQYAIPESQISPWRRVVCGDLSSAFNFEHPNDDLGGLDLPDTSGYVPPDQLRHTSFVPVPPSVQSMPRQEPGRRRARALPYRFMVHGRVTAGRGMSFDFVNPGHAGAAFHVRSTLRSDGPWTYTVQAGRTLADTLAPPSVAPDRYDFSVHGPNGFLAEFKGSFSSGPGRSGSGVEISYRYAAESRLVEFTLSNQGTAVAVLNLTDAYRPGSTRRVAVPAGASVDERVPLGAGHGWFDISVTKAGDSVFLRRVAGHMETGHPSLSDPGIVTG